MTLDPSLTVDFKAVIGAAGFLVSFAFLFGLYRMSSPSTALYGLRVAGAAMLLAILGAFLFAFGVDAAVTPYLRSNIALAAVALVLGGAAAAWRGKRADSASLPQLVALFNAMGAAAVAAIGALELFGRMPQDATTLAVNLMAALLGVIALAGSLIAWARLGGILTYTMSVSGRPAIIGAVALGTVSLGVYIVGVAQGYAILYVLMPVLIGVFLACGLLVGILSTLPTLEAELPISVAIDNALIGAAVALIGLLQQNSLLMIAGMLIAGAGFLLAHLVAKSMNRSIGTALFFEVRDAAGRFRSLDANDAGAFLRYAQRVVVVPGYGLAAAQGQRELAEFMALLVATGVDVKAAVHPLAGRIPGQLEILLSEAGVPAGDIVPPAEADAYIKAADIVLLIGANDIVNPLLSGIKASPLFGVPVFNTRLARKLYVITRTAGAGHADIANPDFDGANCSMIYGDARTVLVQMVEALKVTEVPVAA